MPTSLTDANYSSQNQGHIDQVLSQLAIAYTQDPARFIADRVFPVVPVMKASDLYVFYPRGAFYRDQVATRPMGGRSPIVDFNVQYDTYSCQEEGLAAMIDDRERANATNPISPERAKVKMLVSQHRIHRDRKWANAFFKTGVWTTDVTGVASAPSASQEVQWDVSTSDPIKQMRKRKQAVLKATGYVPNVLVCGADAYLALLDNPQVLARINGGALPSNPALVDRTLLMQAFELEDIVVASGIYNTAVDGAAESMSFIVDSKSALLVYRNTGADTLEEVSGGYIMSWTGLLGDGAFSAPASVFRWRDDPAHSDGFEVRMAWDSKITCPDVGVFFSGIVS